VQLAELGVVPLSVHNEGLKVPGPLLVNMTVPVGMLAVPPEVSVTVAVQEIDWPTTTVEGEQLTTVFVVCLTVKFTVKYVLFEIPVLPAKSTAKIITLCGPAVKFVRVVFPLMVIFG